MQTEPIPSYGKVKAPAKHHTSPRWGITRDVNGYGKRSEQDGEQDAFHLNQNIKKVMAEDKSASTIADFESKFKNALVMFTDYALNLNGFNQPADGKQALMALRVLADDAGIKLPNNIHDDKERSLEAFKSVWNLENSSSTEEIFKIMVRSFGFDSSYGLQETMTWDIYSHNQVDDIFSGNKQGAALDGKKDPEEFINSPDENNALNKDHEVEGSGSMPMDSGRPPLNPIKFRAALNLFTSKLSLKSDTPQKMTRRDYTWTINALGEKLDLSDVEKGRMNTDMFAQKLNIDGDSTISDIMNSIENVFRLEKG